MKSLSSLSVQAAIRKKIRQELCLEVGDFKQALSSNPRPSQQTVAIPDKIRKDGGREWTFK